MAWLVPCVVIWIQTEGGFEKETKRIQENFRFLEETAHVRNIPRYKEEDIDKRELEKWQELGPLSQENTSLRSPSLAGFPPPLQPSPAFLHSPGILSTALLSSPNFFFTTPHLLFWVPGRARSLSVWFLGLGHHLLSLGKLWSTWLSWSCDLSQSTPGPPQFHDINSYSTTNYLQESTLDGVYTSFHFQTTLGKRMPSLSKSVNWGSHTSRDHSELTCTSSPPLCFYGKHRCPESDTILSVSISTILRCLPAKHDAYLPSILWVLLFSACFTAHVYGALRYLYRLFRSPQDPALWGKVPFPHFIVEETVAHRDRVTCTGHPAGEWKSKENGKMSQASVSLRC